MKANPMDTSTDTSIRAHEPAANAHSLPDHSTRKVSPVTRAFIESLLPVSLHKFTPLVAGAVSSRYEWMDADDQNSARAFCCLLLIQAQQRWQTQHPEYSEAQFAVYAKLCVQRLTRLFLPEIKERQRQNQEHWNLKNERARHQRQERWELHQAKHHKTALIPLNALPASSPRLPVGLLRFPTQEEQEERQARHGTEAVLRSAWDEDGCRVSTVHFASSMRLVDKARLFLRPREREMMERLERGERLTEICLTWNISVPRGTQICQQALVRMRTYLLRYRAGEPYGTLLDEARRAEQTAARKINATRCRQQK